MTIVCKFIPEGELILTLFFSMCFYRKRMLLQNLYHSVMVFKFTASINYAIDRSIRQISFDWRGFLDEFGMSKII